MGEKSSSAFLCGTQDWTQVLSPPKVGESEVLSGHACRDMLTSKTFVDLTYHRKFSIKVPGVTVRAYTARGTLQASGQDRHAWHLDAEFPVVGQIHKGLGSQHFSAGVSRKYFGL